MACQKDSWKVFVVNIAIRRICSAQSLVNVTEREVMAVLKLSRDGKTLIKQEDLLKSRVIFRLRIRLGSHWRWSDYFAIIQTARKCCQLQKDRLNNDPQEYAERRLERIRTRRISRNIQIEL